MNGEVGGEMDGNLRDAARVYVGNLKPKANEAHLTEAFSKFGTIVNVWIARKPPGFAFVAFQHESAAKKAIEVYGSDRPLEILGKAVKVQLAGDKAKRSTDKTDEIAAKSDSQYHSKHRGDHRDRRARSRSRDCSKSFERPRRRSLYRRRDSLSRSRSPAHHRRRSDSPQDTRHARRHRRRSRSRSRSSSPTRRHRSRSRSWSPSPSPRSRRHR